MKSHVDFSVPQGCMIVPYFFNLYVSSPFHEIEDIPVTPPGYADDHNARNSFSVNSRTQEMCSNKHLEFFLERTKEWMDINQLKINMSKRQNLLYLETRDSLINVPPIVCSMTQKQLIGWTVLKI